MLFVIMLSGCDEIENMVYCEDAVNVFYAEDCEINNSATNDEWQFWGITGNDIGVDYFRNGDLSVFLSNPMINVYANEEIKRAVVDVLLYTHNFYVDYSNILSIIDEDVSREWFALTYASWISQDSSREGWTILEQVNYFRNFNNESSRLLHYIQSDFMMRTIPAENGFSISVPIYQLYEVSGYISGYILYDFVFEKIDGIYRVIGLSLGA